MFYSSVPQAAMGSNLLKHVQSTYFHLGFDYTIESLCIFPNEFSPTMFLVFAMAYYHEQTDTAVIFDVEFTHFLSSEAAIIYLPYIVYADTCRH